MSPARHEELRELLEFDRAPTVSIYLPLHGRGREAGADRLRLRAAVGRARERLADQYAEEVGRTILRGLDHLLERDGIWGEQAGGMALFLAPGFRRGYRAPLAFEERVVVAPTFHTRPLVDYLTAPQRFYVLELSRNRVQLWEGSPEGLQPVARGSLPRDLADALGFEYERELKVVMRRKERDGTHGEHGRGGIMPVFHGHGVGLDDREPELEAFFRKVDAGLRSFLRGRKSPLILATVEENEALYRSVSELENLAEGSVAASARHWSPADLHGAAWPVAEREAERRVDEALRLWETARGRGEAEAAPEELGPLAVAGRIRLLLTERGREVRGSLDRATGRVEVTGAAGDEAVDLLDELGEVALRHGGDVLPLPPERMPVGTGVAGVLR